MQKPIDPNLQLPTEFATNGVKADFLPAKLLNGFQSVELDVLAGDNINKLIDDTYKGLNFGIEGTRAVNLIQRGETLSMDENNNFVSVPTTGFDTPSDKYIDFTLGASGTNYNAPADGYFIIVKDVTAVGQYVRLLNVEGNIRIQNHASIVGQNIQLYIDVGKNQTLNVTHTAAGSTTMFRFVYKKGAM